MSFRQFRELRLRDFRCFHERQTVPLAPLTLLVGENSTGKTSFLAAVRAVWDAAHGSGDPDFRKPPFDLGSFPEIVYRPGGRGNGANCFEIGFTELTPANRLLDFDVTFESRDAAPAPVTSTWSDGAVSVRRCPSDGKNARIVFESPNGKWYYPAGGRYRPSAAFWASVLPSGLRVAEPESEPSRGTGHLQALPEGSPREPSPDDLAAFSFLSRQFAWYPAEETPFASAPNHPSPHRTYDPSKLSSDPWGADVPSRFANLHLRDKAGWTALKEKLDAFGRESGLFDDFSVKRLTGVEGGPFQLQVRKFGRKGRKGPRRNLMDVGFGVSQSLPVLSALFRADGPPMLLMQQPELHLHPSAQAALGSLFCRTAEAGRQLIIETHSEYIVDRIRMDIRDGRTNLIPDDVVVLFFERSELDIQIHSLRFDEQGNVLGAPDGYGQFFMDETRRSVGL